jgi:Xaa-Pro aminopeptidase
MRRTRLCLLLVSFLLPAALGAQIPVAEYAARRDTVAAHVREGAVLSFGATAPVTDESDFHQLPSFQWLTGYGRPDAAFLMVIHQGKPVFEMLFEPKSDPRRLLYNGFPPDSGQLQGQTGLGLTNLDALRPMLDTLVGGMPLYVVTDLHSRDGTMSDSLTRGKRFVQQLQAGHDGVRAINADLLMDSLRVTKSSAEVALLRRAIAISDDGHRAVMKVVKPGVNEAEVQTVFDYTIREEGASGSSYHAIVGSGPNSTSYHYHANDRPMQAGEVVVIDAGALYLGYAADITRTLPVSGKFSPDQAAIYRIVRAAQAVAESLARPGMPVSAGDSAIRVVEGRELARLGLIESPEASIDPPWADSTACAQRPARCRQAFLYMAHGPGHGIGLEVHDAGGYSYSPTGKFQANEVFTIEPGVYISIVLLDMLPDTPKNRAFIAKVRPVVERYNNIGIRIEDDYLVTATGVEWLSRAPRELEEVEAAMK